MDAVVRRIQVSDASEAARLSAQFGYPVDAAVMQSRIEALDGNCRAVLVACIDDRVAGWIDVCEVHHLQSGGYAEIGGLVVSEECRSRGIGATLLSAAEKWAAERGLNRVVVRSQVKREAAHRFYLREGYRIAKTSVVFTKDVPVPHEESDRPTAAPSWPAPRESDRR
jgi:GNAT superfamily N-acetyltransferase